MAWAMYDWANSAFALSVMTVLFPVMLSGFWNDGASSATSTFRLGVANSTASLIVVILVPLVGALADHREQHKSLLVAWAGLGMLATGALGLVAPGGWMIAAVAFVLGSVGFAVSNSLYDSMITGVAPSEDYDQVSALGYAMGYLGGALLFTFNVIMLMRPQWFGLSSPEQATQWAFFSVAVWWALFTLPLILRVRRRHGGSLGTVRSANSLQQLLRTLKGLRGRPQVLLFLAAYWLYIDGVFTIIKMAVDYGLALGLSQTDLILAILLTNFVGFPAALAFGYLGQRQGPRRGIYLALIVYLLVIVAAGFISRERDFYLLAVAIGLVQGGVQSLSRSFFARLVPSGQQAEYFGLYNMMGKFAAILGPFMAGTVALWTGSQRAGIMVLLTLVGGGLILFSRVREPAAETP